MNYVIDPFPFHIRHQFSLSLLFTKINLEVLCTNPQQILHNMKNTNNNLTKISKLFINFNQSNCPYPLIERSYILNALHRCHQQNDNVTYIYIYIASLQLKQHLYQVKICLLSDPIIYIIHIVILLQAKSFEPSLSAFHRPYKLCYAVQFSFTR